MYGNIRLLIFIAACFSPFYCRADSIPQRFAGAEAGYGFIIPHSRHIEPVSHSNPFGFDFYSGRLHSSETDRRVFNAFWISGLRASYYDFQNPEILGRAFAFTMYTEPIIAFNSRILFTVRGGAGISFHTMIFDAETNPSNQFFGTRINFPLDVSLRFKYRFGEHFFIHLSGNYGHISNGGFKQPNYGMNFPTLSTGIEYYFRSYTSPDKSGMVDIRGSGRRVFYMVEFLSAMRVMEKTDLYPEKRTFATGLHARAAVPLGNLYSLNAGAEFIMDGFAREQADRESESADYKRISLTAGQGFKFGRVHFTQYFGFYVYSPLKPVRWYYQKYELSYTFSYGVSVGVFLKAHLYDAEMMGAIVAITIQGSKKNNHEVTRGFTEKHGV